MKATTFYILGTWITSVVLTPVIFILLLIILPGFHIPDMIGFVLKVYVLPCTLTFAVVNGLSTWVIISNIQKTSTKKSDAKIRLALAVIAITAIITMAIHKTYVFDDVAANYIYILPVSYLIPSISALWFYKFSIGNS